MRVHRSLVLALLLGIAHSPGPALAQAFGWVTGLDGIATISRTGRPSPARLSYMEALQSGDRITLGADSHVEIFFGDVARLTARPFSELAITEEPNGILITLNLGGVTVGVKEAGLRPGEFHEIRTPHALVRMRGSWVKVGVGDTATHIDCLAGEVFVAIDERPLVQCAPGHGFIIRSESAASTP